MNFEIEVYKNQTIEYDDDLDKFVCDMTIEDRDRSVKRQSLKDVRKEIDQFIKFNLEFKPFQLIKKSDYSAELGILNVEGIRTDGKFTVTNSRSKGYDLIDFDKEANRYNNDVYFLYDADVVAESKKILEEEKEYKKLIDYKFKKLYSKLKKFNPDSVREFKQAFKKKRD